MEQQLELQRLKADAARLSDAAAVTAAAMERSDAELAALRAERDAVRQGQHILFRGACALPAPPLRRTLTLLPRTCPAQLSTEVASLKESVAATIAAAATAAAEQQAALQASLDELMPQLKAAQARETDLQTTATQAELKAQRLEFEASKSAADLKKSKDATAAAQKELAALQTKVEEANTRAQVLAADLDKSQVDNVEVRVAARGGVASARLTAH